jgi:hypothetical protein
MKLSTTQCYFFSDYDHPAQTAALNGLLLQGPSRARSRHVRVFCNRRPITQMVQRFLTVSLARGRGCDDPLRAISINYRDSMTQGCNPSSESGMVASRVAPRTGDWQVLIPVDKFRPRAKFLGFLLALSQNWPP